MLIEKKGVNTKSEEKGPQAMSNIICRTESDSLNTQQWYKRNKAEEDMATKAVILVGGPGKVILGLNLVQKLDKITYLC